MENANLESKAKLIFEFVSLRKVLYLIERVRLDEIPAPLRGFTSYANEELLNSIGTPVPKARGEAFIFTNETNFFRGVATLKQKPNLQDTEFSAITAPPVLLLKKVLQIGPSIIYLNFAANDEVVIAAEDLQDVEQLLVLANLAGLEELFLLSDKNGYAMEMSLDEKKYAIAFVNEQEAKATLDELGDEADGAKAEPNRLSSLLKDMLHSPFEGIILNPGRNTQMTLGRDELTLMQMALTGGSKKSSFQKVFQSLFRRG